MWIGFADFEALQISVLKDKKRTGLILQDRPVVGDDADAFLWIAAVIDKDANEHAAGVPLPDSDGQVLIELCEPAGLQDVGQNVRCDFSVPPLQAAHPIRREIGGDERNHDRHHDGGVEKRTKQPKWRKSGSIHHDDFRIGRKLVERMRDRDHQSDR